MEIISKKTEFRKKLDFGEDGEEIVMKYLIEKEHRTCMPMFQFDPTKAPKFYSENEDIIAPDILSWTHNQSILVECKRKNQWVNWNGIIETGVDKKLWDDYCKLVNVTYQDMEIYFLHEGIDPGLFRLKINHRLLKDWSCLENEIKLCILSGEIMPELPYREGKIPKNKSQSPMIYFPKDYLEKLY